MGRKYKPDRFWSFANFLKSDSKHFWFCGLYGRCGDTQVGHCHQEATCKWMLIACSNKTLFIKQAVNCMLIPIQDAYN